MIPTHEVARLLLERCAVLTLPVAYPEAAFTPPGDGKYYEARFFPNGAGAFEGVSTGDLAMGYLQINVVWPKALGIVAPHAAVLGIKTVFPKNLRLFGDGVAVKIAGEPRDAAPLTDDIVVRVPVSIPWNASEAPANPPAPDDEETP